MRIVIFVGVVVIVVVVIVVVIIHIIIIISNKEAKFSFLSIVSRACMFNEYNVWNRVKQNQWLSIFQTDTHCFQRYRNVIESVRVFRMPVDQPLNLCYALFAVL